jgi:hypothetical protein
VRAPAARVCMLHDQRGQRLQLEAGAGRGGGGGVELPERYGALCGGEAAAQGGALGAEAVVAEPDERGARLQAAEVRGELAVAGAEAGGARAELLEVPLLARAGAARGLPVRDLATEPPSLFLVGGRRVLLRRRDGRRSHLVLLRRCGLQAEADLGEEGLEGDGVIGEHGHEGQNGN